MASVLYFYLTLIASILTWIELIIAYFLAKYVQRKYVGWTLTAFSLAFIIYLHIERMIVDYGGWHIRVDTTAMLQCIHLSSFGWDYTDGGENPEKLSREQKKNAIDKFPSFIEFIAAAVCPTQAFAGPSSNYVDFRDYIYQYGIYKHIPSTGFPCLKRFSSALFFIVTYVTLHNMYPPEIIFDSNFLNENFFTRVTMYY